MPEHKHVVLIGLNYHPQKSTGDKNFWVDLIREAASGLEQITVLSIKSDQDQTYEEYIGHCLVSVRFINPKLLESSVYTGKRKYWKKGAFPVFWGMLEKWLNLKQLTKSLQELYTRTPFLHIHLMDNFSLGNRYLARWVSARGITLSVSAITYMGKAPLIYHPYLRLSFTCPGLTVVPYARAYAEKLHQLGIKQIRVIPWGVYPAGAGSFDAPDAPETGLPTALSANTVLFLWAGLIQQVSEDDFFLAKDNALKAQNRGLNALFVFAFKPETFKSYYRQFQQPGKGIYVLATTPVQFRYLQQRADVFYSPVWNRRSIITPPLTWLEMLNYGKPVLTLQAPGVEAVIEEGVTGFACKDEKELIAKMFVLAACKGEMASACRQKIETAYNIKTIAAEYIHLWLRGGESMAYKARKAYQDPATAETYESRRFSSPRGRLTHQLELYAIERAVRLSAVRPPAVVLDLPCGTGRVSRYLASREYEVTGIDISEAMVQTAQALSGESAIKHRLHFETGNGENLACADHSFDLVISLRLFGHLPPGVRQQVLKELARVSRGFVITAFYLKGTLQERLRRKSRKQRNIEWHPVSAQQIDRELAAAGLVRIRSFPLLALVAETIVVLSAKKDAQHAHFAD